MIQPDYVITYNKSTKEVGLKKIVDIETEENSPGWIIVGLEGESTKIYFNTNNGGSTERGDIVYILPSLLKGN